MYIVLNQHIILLGFVIGVNKAFVLKKEISLISATVWERYSLVTMEEKYYWNEYKTIYGESSKRDQNNEGITKFAALCGSTLLDNTEYKYFLKNVTFGSSSVGFISSDEKFDTYRGFDLSCSTIGNKIALASNCYSPSDKSTVVSGETVVSMGWFSSYMISSPSTTMGKKYSGVHVFTTESIIMNHLGNQTLCIGSMIRYDNVYSKGQFIQNISDPSRSKYPDDGYTGITGNYYVFDREEITYGKGDYIDTVTSYNPDEYPANGEQDGYWYVKR